MKTRYRPLTAQQLESVEWLEKVTGADSRWLGTLMEHHVKVVIRALKSRSGKGRSSHGSSR